jgi:hypothetical protein
MGSECATSAVGSDVRAVCARNCATSLATIPRSSAHVKSSGNTCAYSCGNTAGSRSRGTAPTQITGMPLVACQSCSTRAAPSMTLTLTIASDERTSPLGGVIAIPSARITSTSKLAMQRMTRSTISALPSQT